MDPVGGIFFLGWQSILEHRFHWESCARPIYVYVRYAFSPFLPSSKTFLPFAPSPLHKVWPGLDRWLDASFERPGTTEWVEENVATGAFLELLEKLRMVFLQVSKVALLCNDLS